MNNTIHQFTVQSISGADFDLGSLKGKKVMIVNTASKCGLTPQYKQLQALYEKYGQDNFTIIGFPANNFLSQEPGTEEEIVNFCEVNFGVTFPLMSKIDVIGEDIHPVYEFLTNKNKNGVMDSKVTWNFQKFLIDENGNYVKSLAPGTSPLDSEVTSWLGK